MNDFMNIIANEKTFLTFLKGRTSLIHMSNVFFRDFHYGVMAYYESHGKKIVYSKAEIVARGVVEDLEKKNILRRIDHQSWVLLYPEFALPRVEKEKKAS